MQKNDLTIIKPTDSNFPEPLSTIPDCPAQLYWLGQRYDSQKIYIAIVGTRHATQYGKEVAHTIAAELAYAGCVIVSGLAYGIDAAAHQGALDGNGETIAVLGSGHEHLSTHHNRQLAEEITKHGATISEYEPSMHANRTTFPQRNRIIAGLSQMTIVIEAPHDSGALITARFALEYGRDVCAVPGSVLHENHSGTHTLIQKGEAALITSARDVISLLELKTTTEKARQTPLSSLSEFESIVMDALKKKTTSLQQLHKHVSLQSHQLQSTLSHLELKRLITINGDHVFVTR